MIGRDEKEYWHGFDALVGPFHAMVGTFTDVDHRWAASPHVMVHGKVAWADAVLDTALTAADGQRLTLAMRTRWVLRRTADWEAVQAHFSVVPTAPVAAY